jgi:predicted AAA+ superfamily ATPase
MRYVRRELETRVLAAAKGFPAVVLTGPRRAGKTWLLRHLFPGASYYLFEDPDIVARFRQDPQGFLDGVKPPVVLDEIQNVPEVFNFVRARIDRAPRRAGQWFLTGSQEAGLMRNVTESMAGRAAVLQLLPMSVRESPKVGLLRGGFPEVLARPKAASLWFSSYLQTYLERDVRAISAVQDLATFRRFLGLLATRHGQVLNKSDLAAPLGMSVPGIGRWLSILEATCQILVVPPWFENMGRRLIKSPRIYVTDSGLACHLLGIETAAELEKSPFLGALFEGFIAAEIVKAQVNAGRRRELYYFRDQQGLEVDLIVPAGGGAMRMIEVKATRTPMPAMAAPMQRLAQARRDHTRARSLVEMLVVHRPARAGVRSHALAPGVEALPWQEFVTTRLG